MSNGTDSFYFCLNVGAFTGEAGLPILRQSFGFTIAFFSVAGIPRFVLVNYNSNNCRYFNLIDYSVLDWYKFLC